MGCSLTKTIQLWGYLHEWEPPLPSSLPPWRGLRSACPLGGQGAWLGWSRTEHQEIHTSSGRYATQYPMEFYGTWRGKRWKSHDSVFFGGIDMYGYKEDIIHRYKYHKGRVIHEHEFSTSPKQCYIGNHPDWGQKSNILHMWGACTHIYIYNVVYRLVSWYSIVIIFKKISVLQFLGLVLYRGTFFWDPLCFRKAQSALSTLFE